MLGRAAIVGQAGTEVGAVADAAGAVAAAAGSAAWESAGLLLAFAIVIIACAFGSVVVIKAVRGSQILHAVERKAEDVKDTVRREVIRANHLPNDFIDNTPTPMWFKDRQFVMRFINPAYTSVFGVLPSQYVGRTDYEVWPTAIADAFRKHDTEVVAGGVRIEVVESVPERAGDPDAPTRLWRVIKYPHRDAMTGEIKGVGGEAHPVNEDIDRLGPGHELVVHADGTRVVRPRGDVVGVDGVGDEGKGDGA